MKKVLLFILTLLGFLAASLSGVKAGSITYYADTFE
jgi:hypothetical protein